jgi:hypothetical protein
MFFGFLGGIFSGQLSSKRSAFTRSFEALNAGT